MVINLYGSPILLDDFVRSIIIPMLCISYDIVYLYFALYCISNDVNDIYCLPTVMSDDVILGA